jgi:hypothetical protein
MMTSEVVKHDFRGFRSLFDQLLVDASHGKMFYEMDV